MLHTKFFSSLKYFMTRAQEAFPEISKIGQKAAKTGTTDFLANIFAKKCPSLSSVYFRKVNSPVKEPSVKIHDTITQLSEV